MSELTELLSRLPKAAPSVTFDGRALSRDEDHLHLATTSGVIAIPLAEIERVTPLTGGSKDFVSVDIRHGDRIKYVRRVSPVARGLGGFGGFGGGVFQAGGTATGGHYVDSTTCSGGVADRTDDVCWQEDCDDCSA